MRPRSDVLILISLYHLVAGGQTSWHGFAEAIVNAMPADGKRDEEA